MAAKCSKQHAVDEDIAAANFLKEVEILRGVVEEADEVQRRAAFHAEQQAEDVMQEDVQTSKPRSGKKCNGQTKNQPVNTRNPERHRIWKSAGCIGGTKEKRKKPKNHGADHPDDQSPIDRTSH